MNQEELRIIFDKQASGYEEQQKKLRPVHDGLYFQLEWIFSDLPQDARIMCVGLGAGVELSYLASRFPSWRFTAVEPSGKQPKPDTHVSWFIFSQASTLKRF